MKVSTMSTLKKSYHHYNVSITMKYITITCRISIKIMGTEEIKAAGVGAYMHMQPLTHRGESPHRTGGILCRVDNSRDFGGLW